MSRTTAHSCDTPFLSKIGEAQFLQQKRACPQNVVLCEGKKKQVVMNIKEFFLNPLLFFRLD